MKKTILALGLLFAATAAADTPTTAKADVVALSHFGNGTVTTVMTLNMGAGDGLEPGATAFLAGPNNSKLGDVNIARVTGPHSAVATSTSLSEAQVKSSMVANVTLSRKCTLAGTKPNVGENTDVATGKSPPTGYLFADVTWTTTQKESDSFPSDLPGSRCLGNGVRFTIDKGTKHGVVPHANAYVLLPGTGAMMPLGKLEISWASHSDAGGCLTRIGDLAAASTALKGKKIAVEKAHCHHAK